MNSRTPCRPRGSLGRIVTAAGALVLTFALTACQSGDSSRNPGATAEDQEKAKDALLEYAQCMRENGVPMEDPKPGDRGVIVNNVDSEALDLAEAECGHIMEDAMPEDPVAEIPAEEKEAMLAQAQCMRDRGWEFPDPQFGEGGQVQMQLGNGVDPNDPSFQADQEKCAKETGLETPRFQGP